MFDQHRLLKHGATAQGVVTSHKEIAHDQFGGELDYSMHVHVKFEDGTETEIVHRWTKRARVGILRVGDKVPVRYDPADHSKAVIDMPALETAHAQKIADAEATLKRYEQERIAKAQAEIAAQNEAGHKHRH
ncbi:hypothetical protein ABH926_008500 [Catenulispora sp. GP43]|uniref:DUF3592 domain-containing protein n=1 Tax=Catenulispora sp. GP43 TaxID=3156263 RepID=UPI0035155643